MTSWTIIALVVVAVAFWLIGCATGCLRLGSEVGRLREKNRELNRRAQKAESELAKAWLTLGYSDTWSSPQRQREAAERDRMMNAIGKAAKLD